MRRIKKAVATMGKYTDATGQEKNRYQTVGSMFKRDDGSVCLKLDAVPVGPEFKGWINFYDLEEPQQQHQPGAQQPQYQQPPPSVGDIDDEIPFS